MMMAFLATFVFGWWGSIWPGIWYDKPRPGTDPINPWWSIVRGILGGIGAIVITGQVANSDPMPGVFLAIASGAVIAHISHALTGGIGKSA